MTTTAARPAVRMAGALKGISVLVVEDDADTRDLLHLGLSAVGALVRVANTAEAGISALETWRPDVVLCDLQLPGADGYSFLELLRGNPRLRTIPAVALSGVPEAQRRDAPGGFEKHLVKPAKLPDIVVALATVSQQGSARVQAPAERASWELRDILARLNAASGCQFTSLLRFADDGTLVSIWTYDRDNPKIDPFPLGLPLHASYCVLVRDSSEACMIEDASTDPRATDHPRRDDHACYLGAPLFHDDGTMFGTVCCYDSTAHKVSPVMQSSVVAAARELEPLLWQLFDGPA